MSIYAALLESHVVCWSAHQYRRQVPPCTAHSVIVWLAPVGRDKGKTLQEEHIGETACYLVLVLVLRLSPELAPCKQWRVPYINT